MKRSLAVPTLNALALAALLGAAGAAFAADYVPEPEPEPDGPLKVGVLKCKIEGGFGFVLGSNKPVDCIFKRGRHRAPEHYAGSITKIGADIGITTGSYLYWGVFAPGRVGPNALAGFYFGATGEATLGFGPGANVLVGGFANSINLQPVSLQYQTGLNVAGGVAGLSLSSID
jgi:hypothetical protein